jgi:hypothetical protein
MRRAQRGRTTSARESLNGKIMQMLCFLPFNFELLKKKEEKKKHERRKGKEQKQRKAPLCRDPKHFLSGFSVQRLRAHFMQWNSIKKLTLNKMVGAFSPSFPIKTTL